jgi:nicotinate dehydrogenase subunit B
MAGLLRGAALRSPLDMSFAFASEQTIDSLAYAGGIDPLTFRRRNMADPRWLGVLNAAAAAANWAPTEPAHAHPSGGDIAVGWGVGLGTHHVSYGAAVAQIEVNRRTGNIVAKRLGALLGCGPEVSDKVTQAVAAGLMPP